jgi:hypothetical protein
MRIRFSKGRSRILIKSRNSIPDHYQKAIIGKKALRTIAGLFRNSHITQKNFKILPISPVVFAAAMLFRLLKPGLIIFLSNYKH